MTPDEQQKIIRTIIIDELGVDEIEITPNAKIIEDLNADSLDAIELTMRIEGEFGIEIPDEDAEKLVRVQDVFDYVATHAKA